MNIIKDDLKAAVLSLKTDDPNFEPLALEIFRYQAGQNPVYKAFLENLQVAPSKVTHLEKIPCLPISLFKTQKVASGQLDVQHVFESSGTTSGPNAKHYIADLPFYEFLSLKSFEQFYGPISNYHILALLPNYLEKGDSSLVYMVQGFIRQSFSQESGFYLNNTGDLLAQLKKTLDDGKRKILLLGVTFALLDLSENKKSLAFLEEVGDRLIIMETGGMKGRKKEMLREEVHDKLKNTFGVKAIHSEYGMTELFSQAYAQKDGLFRTAPSMRVLLRDVHDPFSYLPSFQMGDGPDRKQAQTGGINVFDLANIDSCCFIETQDLGSYSEDYLHFKVAGRFDNSDIRGCNLMAIA